ncbi:ABC transporter substrate binding protein [compost metagenome]
MRDGVVPASFAVNYEQVGVNAGKIAAQILKGADPKTIAPSRPAYEDHAPLISKKAAAAFGIEVPAALATECNCVVD